MFVVTVDTPGGGPGDWQTPQTLYAALHNRYLFNYDAFASHENTLAARYSTADGTYLGLPKPLPLDGPRLVSSADGLTYAWEDLRVWMNPPYGRGLLEQCMAKAASERENAAIIVALIPVAPATKWWREHVAPFADVTFLSRRVRFIDSATGKPIGSPRFDSAIAVYRKEICW